MTNYFNKLSIVSLILILSLLTVSCSEGDRGFIPVVDEPEEESLASITITGGAVKGPLINTEISIYKFELDQGEIYHFNNAVSHWLNLLDENEIKFLNGQLQLGSISADTVLDNLKTSFTGYGWVSEINLLKKDIKNATSFNDAQTLVTNFLAKETNSKVSDEITKSINSAATLNDLKRDIKSIESLTDKLHKTESFSVASSILRDFKNSESDEDKKDGFDSIIVKLDSIASQSSSFGLSSIINKFNLDIYNVFIDKIALQNDRVALERLKSLKSQLESVSSVSEALLTLENKSREEGNLELKSAYEIIISKIVTIKDFHVLVDGIETLNNNSAIKNAILADNGTSGFDSQLDALVELVNNNLSNNSESAFRASLIKYDEEGVPTNRLSYGTTNEQGKLPGLVIGEYRGFVYLESVSSNKTIDLNTGTKPMLSKMVSIFHTDDILGNGDNAKEDLTVYFMLDGEVQRDSNGEIITDISLVEKEKLNELLEVRPAFFASPLTDFAFNLSLKKLASIDYLQSDSNADLISDNHITESLFKKALLQSSSEVKSTFGIGMNGDSIFTMTPIRLEKHQYLPSEDLNTIQYRLSIESYSSLIMDLVDLTDQPVSTISELLVSDLEDGQIDGYSFESLIDELSSVPQLSYLVKIHPTERLIPGTTTELSNILFKMNEELGTILPSVPSVNFQTKNADLLFVAPVGGVDTDADGILDNEDQFPEDANKFRDLQSGFKGIWSLNFDNSESRYMPFNKNFEMRFKLEEVQGNCSLSPCLGIGELPNTVNASYNIISAPLNHDLVVTPVNASNQIGFDAFATVPGDYLLEANFSTSDMPVQNYRTYIPIHVINPRSIQIKYEPEQPQPGKIVSINFKATKAICELYQICDGIDLYDNVDDYLPLTLLSDVFSIDQRISRGDENLSFTSVQSTVANQLSSQLSNIELRDSVELVVKFQAGSRSFNASTYSNIVGNDKDSDNDGISDIDDFFPNDPNCYLENDGILDSNLDGLINSLDSPYCFKTVVSAASNTITLNFLNEIWHYHPSWHFIIREKRYIGGFNGFIKTPTLTGTKQLITGFKEDQVSKRVYITYKNGSIDLYSLQNQQLTTFTPSYDFNPVKSINLLGTYLLVEYENNQLINLFNKNGSIADIRSEAPYPFPGNAINLKIDGQNIHSSTNNLLTISWVIERENPNNISEVNSLNPLTSDQEQTLNAGQTIFGDVIRTTFNFNTSDNRVLALKRNIFVIGAEKISFSSRSFDDEKLLQVNLENFNPLLMPIDDSSLFVRWEKNNIYSEGYKFIQQDRTYPFILEEKNFELGDLIRASLYIQHGHEELKIASIDAAILGELDQLTPKLDRDNSIINFSDRTANLTIFKPYVNDKFYTESTFTPVWKINQQAVENENSLNFPVLNSTKLKYGDTISVTFKFNINGVSGETAELVIGKVEIDSKTSVFTLNKKVVEEGSDVSINFDEFTDAELETLQAKWTINGVHDESIDGFTYPASKLHYGDSIALQLLLRENKDPTRVYQNIATGSVGVNLESVLSNSDDSLHDIDTDNDGIPNHRDYFRNDAQCSAKEDGIPDDLDGDGIADLDELFNSNPNFRDTDGDGLSDIDETLEHGTNPNSADTDGDSYIDSVEIYLGFDPLNEASPGTSFVDNDFDGLTNQEELQLNTKVNVFDTDNDGLSDWYEIQDVINGQPKDKTNPLNPDSDGDKISDGAEIFITKTDPMSSDSDSDGLTDGLEVSLKLNPNDSDTDKDGILDANEQGYNFALAITKVLYRSDLINYQNNFSTLKTIKQGTCFKTWLANNEPNQVKFTYQEQLDETSNQEIAFASDRWNQILRYDADAKNFVKHLDLTKLANQANNVLSLPLFNAYVTSLSYDVMDPSKLYIGFSDGWVRMYDSQLDMFTSLYQTGEELPVTTILNQQNILIAEQKNSNQEIIHSVFDRVIATEPQIRAVKSTYISDVSYANFVWIDNTFLQLYLFDANVSLLSFVKQTLDTTHTNPVVGSETIELNSELAAPLFLEKLASSRILHFGNGVSYKFSDQTVSSNLISPFSHAINHQDHRVIALKNSTILEATTQSDSIDNQYWRFKTTLPNNKLMSVIPVGHHLLTITTSKPTTNVSGDGKISFQSIILGDESNDGLPDWWNRLSTSGTNTDFYAFELSSDSSIPDYLDGTPNIDDSITPPVLQDSDGDGICDHWEINLFNTNPYLQDTDDDGRTDAQELNINPVSANNCENYPFFWNESDLTHPPIIMSDPNNSDSDGDGLEDGEEVNNYGTKPLNHDSDGDGLSDYQEVFITFTNPNLPDSDNNGSSDGDLDSDNDGLTDSDEINLYQTSHLLKDSDSDGLNDDQEVLLYGTNPNDVDTDGDSLNDYDEIFTYKTLANSIDSDADGLSDPVELNISSLFLYSSNPLIVDSDGDGLSDLEEFNFEFDYTDEEITLLNNPRRKSNPLSKDSDNDGICDRWEVLNFNTNPAEIDTEGDGLSDNIEMGITSALDCSILPTIIPISSPELRDTDQDRILDGDEVLILQTDPNDKDSDDNRVNDDLEDPDKDGLNNYQELYLTKTDPFNPDSDGDGLNDADDDNDNDGLSNIDEVNTYGTDPLNEDSDNDGISDFEELTNTSNPSDPTLNDSDGDGLSDKEEDDLGTNPRLRDSDRDGVEDFDEVSSGTDPNDPDTDHDFLLDGLDDNPRNPDFDNDGIPDGIEVNYLKTDPSKTDTDEDGKDDNYEAWVFAFTVDEATNAETNIYVSTGTSFDEPLNSHFDDGLNWPMPKKFSGNNKDRLVFDLTDVLDSTKVKGRLYVQRFSDPEKIDSDGDGLTDATEFEIERVYGVEYRLELGINSFDPQALNSENFKISDPWNKFTGFIIDSDGDGINDFYEEFYTLTNPNNPDSDGDGITDDLENEDEDLLTNLQEVLYGSDPNLADVSPLDSDGDGLSDVIETMLLKDNDNNISYDSSLSDTDGDGISDGFEDPDQDLLTNLEEMRFKTDPFTKDFSKDSDADGLSDYQEYYLTGTNPFLEDSNSNGVLDGQEDPDSDSISNLEEMRLGGNPNVADDIANILDSDNDGLTDYQEINMTFTNPSLSDSDGNGIGDAQEDSDSDGLNNFQEVNLGTNPTLFDSDLLQKDKDNDGLSDVYELKITGTDPNKADTNEDGVIDGYRDSDNDGLTDFVEILLVTSQQSKDIAQDQDADGITDAQERLITKTNPNAIDSDSNGILDGEENPDRDPFSNFQEIENFTNPYAENLSDNLKDADGDYLVNGLDEFFDNQLNSVTTPDQDNDSIPDGIEALILKTQILSSDTDNDDILDQDEIKSWNIRQILISETCLDSEIRLPSVAGKHYCVSIEYYSYPTLSDSDNDGVPDRSIRVSDNAVILDHYPLDPSCNLAADGFTKEDLTLQCFSSWMAESDNIELIKRAQWTDTSGVSDVEHADILFFDPSWDAIVIYNALTSGYSDRIQLKTEIDSQSVNLVDFSFSATTKELYLLYSDATVDSINIQTRVVQSLGQFKTSDYNPESLFVVNGSKLLLSYAGTTGFEYRLLNISGVVLDSLVDSSLSLKYELPLCLDSGNDCTQSVSIFGFADAQNDGYAHIGRVNIDLVNDAFETLIVMSTDLQNGETFTTPIRLSADKQYLQFGSGHTLDLSLQSLGTHLSFQHDSNVYRNFYDFSEYADHFVGVVDVNLLGVPDGSDISPKQNGIFITELESIKDTLAIKLPGDDSINDLKSLNQYLLQPVRNDEKVERLLPFSKTAGLEIAVIKRSNGKILIESLGLLDEDNDLMTGVYEKVFGLDDSDSSDKFEDLDMDGLSNVEEYFFATDPTNSDSDFDGWTDIEEILRGTLPNNPLSY